MVFDKSLSSGAANKVFKLTVFWQTIYIYIILYCKAEGKEYFAWIIDFATQRIEFIIK